MKRFFVFAVFIPVSFLFVSTGRAADMGSVDAVITGAVQIANPGGYFNGSTFWVEQDVSSTFTGDISKFSIVAKYASSPTLATPLVGTVTNQNTSESGQASIPYTEICDNSHNIASTSTGCIIHFQLDNPVHVTATEIVTMRLDSIKSSGGYDYGVYNGSTRFREPSFVAARVHTQNSGGGGTIDWDTFGYGADYQLMWAWNHNTSTPPEPSCTENCHSNILFLPGIEGSRLYSAYEKLWEPGVFDNGDIEDLFLSRDGTSTRSDIYTDSIIDEFYIGFVPTLNIYKTFLEDLNDWKSTSTNLIADYAAIPYDWRLSLDDILNYGRQTEEGIYYSGDQRSTSTPFIIEQLRTLAQTSRTGKVTIVAHSYGGLVAKALIKKLEATEDPLLEKIDNLVLVAVPQTGTPQAIGAGLHAFNLGMPSDLISIVSLDILRTFASTTPSLYNLLPSENYFTNSGGGSHVSTSPVTFVASTATEIFVNAYGTEIDGTAELYNFLSGYEGRSAPTTTVDPSILFSDLLADAEDVHFELDTWTPPTSTKVYQIAGWGIETVGSIKYEHQVYEGIRFMYTPELIIDGDGTVVEPSALAMSTSTENVTRYWLNLRAYNNAQGIFEPARNHADIFEVSDLRNLIKNNILIQATTTLPLYVSSSQPLPDLGDIRLDFFLHSPLLLSAYDQLGNEVSQKVSSIPGAIYRRFGEVQYISVPKKSAPLLKLTGYASGYFTLDVQERVGNEVIANTRFSGVPSSTSTQAAIQFLDGAISSATSLKIDFNGDGLNDANIDPVLNGTIFYDKISSEFKKSK